MENPRRDNGGQNEDPQSQLPARRSTPNLWVLLIIAVAFVVIAGNFMWGQASTIPYYFFKHELERGNIAKVELASTRATGEFLTPPKVPKSFNKDWSKATDLKSEELVTLQKKFSVEIPKDDKDIRALIEKSGAKLQFARDDGSFTTLLLLLVLIPGIMFLLMWMSFRRTRDQIMGGGFLSGFSKSPAKRYEGTQQAITFADVAGLEGVKADLKEIVDYLKDPEKFQRLGGRVPKGVLLNGPPGTGKTLLARAVAGEAGVPFYSVNGSEFIQMFVGVGASRVRDLFQNAKEHAPGIIFVDEIDAVGRQRGAGLGGGHDEREQTLNQILSEMDGFARNDSVIVLAATNRPDVLDPALLRPGRFDRHVTVDRPTHKGRHAIFKVHVREVPLGADVDLDRLASATVGLTGADIQNLVNEAALWAARHDKKRVEMSDFDYARDKVLMGGKREEVLQDEEREKTAYHEAGHTLTAWFLKGANPVHKVTIIPRGRALGVTQVMPSEDKLSMSRGELIDHLIFLLGGRAAERLIYGEGTAGAENDLERATSIARRMVTHWGMSDRLGPVSYKLSDDDPFLGREIHQNRQFSEHTMQIIDDEVASILRKADEDSLDMVTKRRDALEKITQGLLQHEELDQKDIEALIGPSVHVKQPAPLGAQPASTSSDSDSNDAGADTGSTDENINESEANVEESHVTPATSPGSESPESKSEESNPGSTTAARSSDA